MMKKTFKVPVLVKKQGDDFTANCLALDDCFVSSKTEAQAVDGAKKRAIDLAEQSLVEIGKIPFRCVKVKPAKDETLLHVDIEVEKKEKSDLKIDESE
jgi:hypothetical protein